MGARWVPRSHLLNCGRAGITTWGTARTHRASTKNGSPGRSSKLSFVGGIGVRLRLRLRRDRLRSKPSFERSLVGRPGLEPGTTGLKVSSQAYKLQQVTTRNQPQQQEANGLTGDLDRLGVWWLVVEIWHLLSSSAPGGHQGPDRTSPLGLTHVFAVCLSGRVGNCCQML